MTVSPTGSYLIDVPDQVMMEIDGRVTSFWLDGQPSLLQLSSVQRFTEAGPDANERLRERLQKMDAQWEYAESLVSTGFVDQAFAWQHAADYKCLHGYLVWPHLAIYASASGPAQLEDTSWPLNALRTIVPNPQ